MKLTTQIVFIFSLLIISVSASSNGSSQNEFNDVYSFESGDLSNWDTLRLPNKNSAFVVKSPLARFGKSYAHFVLKNGDKSLDANRVEIKNNFHATQDSEFWYSFSSYIPDDFAIAEDNHCITAQWHDQESTFHSIVPGYIGNPPISHRVYGKNGGRLVVKLKLTHVYLPQKIVKSKKIVKKEISRGWSDYIYNIAWSSDKNFGKVRIWERTPETNKYNQIANYHGVTWSNPWVDVGYNIGPYLKFGLYCKNTPKKHSPASLWLRSLYFIKHC